MVHYWGSGDYCFKVTATGEYGTLKCRTCIYCLLKFNIRNCLMEKKVKKKTSFSLHIEKNSFPSMGYLRTLIPTPLRTKMILRGNSNHKRKSGSHQLVGNDGKTIDSIDLARSDKENISAKSNAVPA